MVSVIIPYYNRPEKLRRCLDSVLNQTYQNFEIIIIDDCSREPLHSYTDSRIKIFRNHKNLGPGLSRNVGIDNAKGKFLAFLDCDDYWHADFLNTILHKFNSRPDLSMIYANCQLVGKNNELIGLRREPQDDNEFIIPYILINGRPWETSACIWNRKILKDIRFIDSWTWEDYAFDIDVGIISNRILGIKQELVFYDTVGNDKLSNQKHSRAVKSKAISLIHISQALFNSRFNKNFETRVILSYLLLSSLISLKLCNEISNNLVKEVIKEFGVWNGILQFSIVKTMYKTPASISTALLRRYRQNYFKVKELKSNNE